MNNNNNVYFCSDCFFLHNHVAVALLPVELQRVATGYCNGRVNRLPPWHPLWWAFSKLKLRLKKWFFFLPQFALLRYGWCCLGHRRDIQLLFIPTIFAFIKNWRSAYIIAFYALVQLVLLSNLGRNRSQLDLPEFMSAPILVVRIKTT